MIPPEPGTPPADTNGPDEPGEPEAPGDGDRGLVPLTPSSTRPGAGTFTIEGRSAPALFVVGWLATLLGLGCVFIAIAAGGRGAAPALFIVGFLFLSLGLVAGAGSQGIERRVRARTAYRGPSPFLVFATAIPVSLLVVIALGVPMALVGIAVDGPLGRLISVSAQTVIYVSLIRLLVVDVGALTWVDMGLRRFDRRALRELGTGALYAAPGIFLTLPVVAVVTALLPVQPVSPLPPAGENTGFVFNLMAGAIVAPIGEELLFRGFATTAWARDLGPRRALVRGALFFAVVHVLTISGDNPPEAVSLAIIQFVTRVPVALALGWLFLRRGSIWAPIGLHAAFNGSLIVLAELAVRSGAV